VKTLNVWDWIVFYGFDIQNKQEEEEDERPVEGSASASREQRLSLVRTELQLDLHDY